MSVEIRKDDIGTVFEFTIKDQDNQVLDISGATKLEMVFLKPDRQTTVTKTAVFTTDGTDGKMRYTAETGFLDTVGDWQRQGYVVLVGGEWRTSIRSFRVLSNLE